MHNVSGIRCRRKLLPTLQRLNGGLMSKFLFRKASVPFELADSRHDRLESELRAPRLQQVLSIGVRYLTALPVRRDYLSIRFFEDLRKRQSRDRRGDVW